MTFDQEQQQPRARAVHADGAHADGPVADPAAVQQDREAAWKAIEKFAKDGTGAPKDLPGLIKRAAWNDGVVPVIPDLAKRIDGDLALECARAADMGLAASLGAAFGAKSPPTVAAVRRLLRTQSMHELGGLDDEVTAKLRGLFKKEPFNDVLPELDGIPFTIIGRPKLIQWFIETTDPTIVGIRLSHRGDQPALIETLDSLPNGWDWVDHMRIAPAEKVGSNLAFMAENTKSATAKPALEALARQFTTDANRRKDEEIAARGELDKQLTGKDDAALVEAAARTQESVSGDGARVGKRLRGESPSMVIELLTTTKQTPEKAIDLIDGAKGASAEHMREALRLYESIDVVKALVDDRLRKIVRLHLGRGVSVLDLFPKYTFSSVHKAILGDAALRQWAYEDDHPETLLHLAAGSAEGAADGTRLVKKEKTNAWVKRLSPGADEESLRRFTLASTDGDAVKFVREKLLRDPAAATVDPSESEVVAPDNLVYGTGATANLAIATMGVGENAETAVTRLADLDDGERVAVLKDPQQLRWLLDDVSEHTLVRAMFLLRPTVQQLVKLPFPPGARYPELHSYLATRPHGEGFVAAKDPAQIKRIRELLGPWSSPVDIFPELRDGHRLGKALLADNVSLFEWIMEDTEPNRAMKIFAQDGVRDIAAHYLGERQDLAQNLPDHDNLTKDGKRHYGILHERVEGPGKQDSADYVSGETSGDQDADARAKDFKKASKKTTLWEEIDELAAIGDGDTKPGMLSLVGRAPADQQITLLDGKHEDSVRRLRTSTNMKPQHIFHDLTPAQLFALEGSANWLFLSEAPTVILHMLAGSPAAIKSAAKRIDADPMLLSGWPRGGALSAQERFVLDELAKHVTSVAAMHELFGTRFDVTVKNFDAAETRKMWKIAARLPPAQFNQQAVENLVEADIAPLGQWSDPDIEIDDSPERFEKPDNAFDEQQKLTLDDVKQMYGLSEDDIAVAADPESGWLEESGGLYTVKPVENPQLDATVLHEIGHSIDTLLGEQTELVYGLAGWKRYGIGQFEQWADDMGGFAGIADHDRPAVVDVWKNALTSKTPVNKLVGPDHPALKGTAPLVDAANRGILFEYTENDKSVYGDHVCVNNQGALYSMTRSAYLTAPSEYSLSAPAEYFAECYTEYYRGYDGTPKSESAKGGRLANWVKDWFAQNVDRIRLNPKRVRKP